MTELKRMQPLLGTFVEIGVISDDVHASKIITESFNIIKKIEQLLSFHNPQSDLSRLNKMGHKGVNLDPISADVLRLALHITGLSQGDFNCTIAGSLIERGVLPNHGGMHALPIGNVDDVVLEGCRATLLRPVRITLDGIAKGYAVDQAVNVLKHHGIESGWVNAGGDLRMFGEITLPIYQRQQDDSCLYLGDFSNTAIATSSNGPYYDRRFPGLVLDGKNRNHNVGVWTVKAGLSWLADALTKVAGVNPTQQAKDKIATLGGELLTVRIA